MEKSFYTIFKTFFKVGTILLGGGYVILPLLKSEIVEKKMWITSKTLCEFYTLAQSLPGILAVNTSAFVGHHLNGQKGAIAAVLGIVSPAFISIVMIASVLEQIFSVPIVKYVFSGVSIGVILLLMLSAKEMWDNSSKDKFSIFVFLFTFILAVCFKISPVILVLTAIFVGVCRYRFDKNFQVSVDDEECEK